jgi:hypothetical protein
LADGRRVGLDPVMGLEISAQAPIFIHFIILLLDRLVWKLENIQGSSDNN